MKKEIWKEVNEYPDYMVSNSGIVKSLKFGKEKILKQGLKNNGYFIVVLSNNSIKKSCAVHKLVATAFLNHKPCGYDLVINHIDFNRQNNNVNNLEIVKARDNTNQKHLKSYSKYTGVYYCKIRDKWKSSLSVNGITKYLGSFSCEKEASYYYEKAIISINKNEDIEVKSVKFTSAYKGVSWSKSKKKWEVYKKVNGKSKYIGCRNCEIEANNLYIQTN